MAKILIWVLLGLLIFLVIRVSLLNKTIGGLAAASATLPADTQRQVIVQKNTVTYKYREPLPTCKASADSSKEQADIIKMQARYVPPEGSLKITQKTDGSFELATPNAGFTFAPFGGIGAAGEGFGFYGGARLFYYKRYGLGLAYGGSSGSARAVISADRRMDDIIPFLNNTAAGVYVGRGYFGISFNVYL